MDSMSREAWPPHASPTRAIRLRRLARSPQHQRDERLRSRDGLDAGVERQLLEPGGVRRTSALVLALLSCGVVDRASIEEPYLNGWCRAVANNCFEQRRLAGSCSGDVLPVTIEIRRQPA